MADSSQKTEKATPKRRKEVREKGTVARSPEVGGWAGLVAVTGLLPWLGGLASTRVDGFVQRVVQAMAHPTRAGAVALVGQGLATAAFAALPVTLVSGVVAVAIATAQVGLHVTPQALGVRLSRISPKSGLQRVVSRQGAWTLLKTSLKVAVLAVVAYDIERQLVTAVLGGATLPLESTLSATAPIIMQLLRVIGIVALVVAGADYFFQRRSYNREVRMTRQEVKDERRESEGNPEVRRALRSRARRLSRMHVMAAVARADVVVTNPTHFAVALAYDRATDVAPRVVAKGEDLVAVAIRAHARRCGVVLVENPPLARALHASCEIDELVPARLYTAVAQLLAFVYALTPTARSFREVHRMAGPVPGTGWFSTPAPGET